MEREKEREKERNANRCDESFELNQFSLNDVIVFVKRELTSN